MIVSNFASPTKGSAFWGREINEHKTIERTQGYSFVRAVQQMLKKVFTPNRTVDTYRHKRKDGKYYTTVNTADLQVDGNWGPVTTRVLAAYLKLLERIPEAVTAFDNVAAVETSKKLNPNATKAAIYVAYHGEDDPSGMLSDITIFPGTVLPPFGAPPPVDSPDSRGVVDTVRVEDDFESAIAGLRSYNAPSTPQPAPRVITTDNVPPVPVPAPIAPVVPNPNSTAITTPHVPGQTAISKPSGTSNTVKYLAIGALVVGGIGLTYAILTDKK